MHGEIAGSCREVRMTPKEQAAIESLLDGLKSLQEETGLDMSAEIRFVRQEAKRLQ